MCLELGFLCLKWLLTGSYYHGKWIDLMVTLLKCKSCEFSWEEFHPAVGPVYCPTCKRKEESKMKDISFSAQQLKEHEAQERKKLDDYLDAIQRNIADQQKYMAAKHNCKKCGYELATPQSACINCKFQTVMEPPESYKCLCELCAPASIPIVLAEPEPEPEVPVETTEKRKFQRIK